jgi:hypothetical protein
MNHSCLVNLCATAIAVMLSIYNWSVWVWMTHPVWANSFNHVLRRVPILFPAAHMVITWVVYWAKLSCALFTVMNANDNLTTYQRERSVFHYAVFAHISLYHLVP